jgi:CheY-like chemotaxis protein
MNEGSTDRKRTYAHVRHALEHLYDADALAEHWLIAQLKLTHESARTGALRRYLIAAIERMRPDAQESPETPRWQMYQVLFQRYVQGTQADSLADQLGMSSRNLRRMQNRAIAYLAETLFQEHVEQPHQSDPSALPAPIAAPTASPITRDDAEFMERVNTVDEEIGWLRDAILSEPVNVAEVWEEAQQFFAPLARSAGVAINPSVSNDLPKVAIHPTGLRQVMLSILNHLVEQSHVDRNLVEQRAVRMIEIAASASGEKVQVTFHTAWEGEAAAPTTLPSALPLGLLLAQRILSMFGGQLQENRKGDGYYEVQVSLMTAGGTRVLVIDDNPDILQLYQRYVTGTRYQLIVCEEPGQALAMATSHSPKAIVLDIMMPGIDGWSLLGKLRHHPATAAIPVIISTIVPEQGLALALGADDFLKKPVTRALFLSALDRLPMQTVPEFH